MENMTALDTQTLVDVGLVQPEPEETQTEEPSSIETNAIDEGVAEDPQSEPIEESIPTPLSEFEIDGIGKVTVDDIKEWRSGNMRQSDYSRKTQELAKQREEVGVAIEVFNYLQQNPYLLEQLTALDEKGEVDRSIINKATPENTMLRELWFNQKSMELDQKVESLKQKYGEVDETLLYNTAREMKTDNLEMVYKAIAFDNNQVDRASLIEQAKNELRQELQQTRNATQTIVSGKPTQPIGVPVALTKEEERMASVFGMSREDYAKWRDK